MIGLKNFSDWLSRDISIDGSVQKIIMKKVVEYINLKSIDGKTIKQKNPDLILDKKHKKD